MEKQDKQLSAGAEPIFNISSPEETRHLAIDLARFIQENKLFHNIQGKEYVNVEGWQYAGSRLGILPQVEELNRVRDGQDENTTPPEMKYQAKVRLVDLRNEQVVGTGFAICSNREPSKKYYQEFAIASMAQTRAIGKAYRNILAWIIRAAGYEPTPAEEMDYADSGKAETPQRPVKPLKEEAKKDIQNFEAEKKPLFDDKGNPIELATDEQFALIVNLTKSHLFTPDEQIKVRSNFRNRTKASASEAIEKTKAELDARKAKEKAEKETADASKPAEPKPITINQKTQVLLLLNNSCITKEEKEKTVAKLSAFDTVRADECIAKLKQTIKDRGTSPVPV